MKSHPIAPLVRLPPWLCCCNDVSWMLNYGADCQCCRNTGLCADEYCRDNTEATENERIKEHA